MAIPNCEWFEVLAFNRAGYYSLEHLSYGLAEPIEIDARRPRARADRSRARAEIDWELIDSARTGEIS